MAMLDAQPLAGRLFSGEPNRERTSAMISETFWRGRLGGAPLAGRRFASTIPMFPSPASCRRRFEAPASTIRTCGCRSRHGGRFHVAGGRAQRRRAATCAVWPARRRTHQGAGGRGARVARRRSQPRGWAGARPRAVVSAGERRNPEMRAIAQMAYLPMGMLGAVLLVAMINVSGLLFRAHSIAGVRSACAPHSVRLAAA